MDEFLIRRRRAGWRAGCFVILSLAACASNLGTSGDPEKDGADAGDERGEENDSRDATTSPEGTVTTPVGPSAGPPDAGRDGSDAAGKSEGGADADSRVAAPDAGAPDGRSVDAADPLSLSARCTSGKTWNGVGDQNMRPGEICSSCHSNYNVAGTLYPTGHEPNDCDGVDGLSTGATILLTDATGLEITLYPNAVGNFFTSITVTPPYHAKVVLNGNARAMASAQSSAACNSCHTQAGASGAPGRIVLP